MMKESIGEKVKRLVGIRNPLKKKKPVFLRQDAQKKKKLGNKWRKPKGMHSKMRRMLSGHKRRPEPGWGSPSLVTGLSKEGLKKVAVNNLVDMKTIEPKMDGIVIGSRVGMKKKIELVKKAKEIGAKVLNFDADKFIAAYEERQKIKTEGKAKTLKEKQEKQKEKEKKAEEKEKETKSKT